MLLFLNLDPLVPGCKKVVNDLLFLKAVNDLLLSCKVLIH